MTDTIAEHAAKDLEAGTSLVEMDGVGKAYGAIRALEGVNLTVNAGEVTCVLGDNGAGKSTLIKIISGLHPHSEGTLKVDGKEVHFSSPRAALDVGIATVYQDLAVVGLMEVWRNFFLGSEIRKGKYPFAPLDIGATRRIADEELQKMGIRVKDINQPIGTLSGGQRQCVAIARAVYFGARVLILDEPTAALGVKQSGVVLKYTAAARDAGLGVVFITHNPHHAYLVGDHFIILKLGRRVLDKKRSEVSLEELTTEMAGGQELAELPKEMKRGAPRSPGARRPSRTAGTGHVPAGAAVVDRTTSRGGSTISRCSVRPPSRRSTTAATALSVRPCESWLTVVRPMCASRESGLSSYPATDMSVGTPMPVRTRPSMRPTATRSLNAITAVGTGRRSVRPATARMPDSSLCPPRTTMTAPSSRCRRMASR